MSNFKHFMVVLLALIAAGFMFSQRGPQGWTPMQIAGVAVGIPALILWAVAHQELGKSFTVRAEARQLVTHGLYSKIRNPIYLFGSIFIAGIILFFGKLVFFLVFLALIPMQVIRAKKESQVLQEKFGQEYIEYKKKTWL